MEINKDLPDDIKQTLFIQSLLEQDSLPPSLAFGRDLNIKRGGGKLVALKRDGFWCALIGGCQHVEAGVQQTRSRASYAIG